jgi:hypothetical protein
MAIMRAADPAMSGWRANLAAEGCVVVGDSSIRDVRRADRGTDSAWIRRTGQVNGYSVSDVAGYEVPVDPMDDLQCESCQ